MENESKSAFDLWEPFQLRPEILSIVVVFLILAGFCIYYYFYMKKLDPKQPPKGIAFFIFNLINFFKNLVFETLGPRFMRLTPYFIALFTYVAGCNLVTLVGFENPTASTTVTFSLGFVTVVGMICVAVRYQKSRFFLRFAFKFEYKSKKTGKEYLIPYFFNPFGIVDIVTPLLSVSLRLWGNIFAGALIMSLIYAIPMVMFGVNPLVNPAGPEVLLFSIVAMPFHGFFDLLIGTIQAFVFLVLTMSYWSNETSNELANEKLIEQDQEMQSIGYEKFEKQSAKAELINSGLVID